MQRQHILLVSAAAILLLCFALNSSATSKDFPPSPGKPGRGHFTRTISVRQDYHYCVSVPADYAADRSKRWPLMLFLHGAGERGTNLDAVTIHGPPKLVKEGKDLPFVVISPQCPTGQIWDDAALIGLVDDALRRYRIDEHRVYVTGLSMGGYGTWSLIARHPERFAAAAPICGGGERIRTLLLSDEQKRSLKTMGIWAFHGGKDSVVPLEESERMVQAVKKAGNSDVKLTVYPDADHDSWTATYANPDLYKWLLQHSR
ncbi:MAG: prolyl oligopeptidase family serine peptidase [Verrucomicrobia bacterium]|nr:prolyl oligopeptidase family serine peptidase [Verrucomicrobiota bacterium]MBI3867943.1 prolyl oligopeptidase family serine peptidase [Verrucomicrobiota bacterium]